MHSTPTADATLFAGGLAPLLQTPKRIAIVSHVRPDGDAIGSTLGLFHFLKEQGHQPIAINPSDVPAFLSWLPDASNMLSGESHPEGVDAALGDAELLFCLDFGELARTEHLEPLLRSFQGTVVNLDHHLQNERFAQHIFADTHASSTCELVYRFIQEVAPSYAFSQNVATSLYTGLMTDTGSFRFNTTTPDVHRAVATLLEAGANVQAIHRRVYDSYTEQRTRLLGFCLSERLTVLREVRTAYITLSAEDQIRFGVQPGDTEGIVNYALGIQGINLGVILIEKDGHVKMSFRSVGQFSAANLASHFQGGGHYNAAGGKEAGTIATVEAKLVQLLHHYADSLTYEPYAD